MKKMGKFLKETHFLLRWIIYSVVSFLIISGVLFLASKFGLINMINIYIVDLLGEDINVLDVLFTQCSTTFIIVSFISFLGGNSEEVLWDDTIGYNLMHPTWFNFVGLSAYLICDLIISIALTFSKCVGGLLISFLFSILFIIMLIYRIIGAFFSRDGIKNRLIKSFARSEDNDKERFLKVLEERTFQKCSLHQYKVVLENIEFFAENGYINYLDNVFRYLSESNPSFYLKTVEKYKAYYTNIVCSIDISLANRIMVSKSDESLLTELISDICAFSQEDGVLIKLAYVAIENHEASSLSIIVNHFMEKKEYKLVEQLLDECVNQFDAGLNNVFSNIKYDEHDKELFEVLIDLCNKLIEKEAINYTLLNLYEKVITIGVKAVTRDTRYDENNNGSYCVIDNNYGGKNGMLKSIYILSLKICFELVKHKEYNRIKLYTEKFKQNVIDKLIEQIVSIDNKNHLDRGYLYELIYFLRETLLCEENNQLKKEIDSQYTLNPNELKFDWSYEYCKIKYMYNVLGIHVLSKLDDGDPFDLFLREKEEILKIAKKVVTTDKISIPEAFYNYDCFEENNEYMVFDNLWVNDDWHKSAVRIACSVKTTRGEKTLYNEW